MGRHQAIEPVPALSLARVPDALARQRVENDESASVRVPAGSWWKRLTAFMGPGYLVAVGYMDPGNWATDIAAGSAFGYRLLFVVFLSSCIAMVLQALAARLGIVTGMDLAQACRARYSPPVRVALWLLCEIAIIACDLAELLGTAIALQLLVGLPLGVGVCVAALNVFAVMALEQRGFRKVEALIVSLMLVVALCLGFELILSQPDLSAIGRGLLPDREVAADPKMLYLAIGIVGATIMPHNLYLHSAIVQTRRYDRDLGGKREAVRFASIDSAIALTFAFVINAAILILAASAFHVRGESNVTEISQAYRLLAPMLGAGLASVMFGIALLAAGQNATITGSMAGQIVMEGFTRLRMPLWKRRILTRAVALVPAAIVASLYGGHGASALLILSQVVLSIQLPFAAIPLVRMCEDRALMGEFASGPWMRMIVWSCVAFVVTLNIKLVLDFF
jgi:manganese transport protein